MEYTFVLRGRLREILQDALDPATVVELDDSTEIRLEIEDDAQLYGVLARMERLGMSIESFEPTGIGVGHPTDTNSSMNPLDR